MDPNELEENEAINHEPNDFDNAIFNNNVVPNHIDIIEFNSGDEENIEPEIFFENENQNNVFIT